MARTSASEMPTTSPPSAAPPPSPIATWSPIRAWLESPAISSAAVPTAVTRPTRRWLDTRDELGPERGEVGQHGQILLRRASGDYPLSTIKG